MQKLKPEIKSYRWENKQQSIVHCPNCDHQFTLKSPDRGILLAAPCESCGITSKVPLK